MIEFLIVASVVGAFAGAAGSIMVQTYREKRREYAALGAAELERKLPPLPEAHAPEALIPVTTAQMSALASGADIPIEPLEGLQPDKENNLFTRLMLDDSGNLIRQHYRLCGATRSGKTTFGEHLLQRVQGNKAAQKYLINPKHRESNPTWSIPPFVKTIEQALAGLQRLELLLKQRIIDPNFNPDNEPLLLAVVDEWDWIYEVYGDEALAALRALFKVGSELGVFVILLGQSPLTKDTGLSQSDNQNFCQIVLGSEATKLLSGSSFYHRNREELYQQSCKHQEGKERFALVVPREGKPFVSAVPHLEKPQQTSAKRQQDSENKEKLTPEQAKLAFMFGLPSETPQHEQPLAPYLEAIIRYANKRGGSIKVKEIQPAKLPELEGYSAEQIRAAFSELAALRRATVTGFGGNMTLVLGAGE